MKKLSNQQISLLAILLFSILGTINLLSHEMWRDELDSWLVARGNSFTGIAGHMKFAGHPVLWYLALWFVQHISANPVSMQILHLLIATATISIILAYSPFSQLQKILLVFSYFFFYEYAIVCRSYSLGFLMVFAICALLTRKNSSPLWCALLIAMLVHTHVLSLILAGTLTLYILLDWRTLFPYARRPHIVAFALIVFSSFIAFMFYAIPDKDYTWYPDSAIHWDYGQAMLALKSIWSSYLPLPQIKMHFWNTNMLSSGVLQNIGSILLIALSVLFFANKRKVMLFYVATTFAYLGFFYKFYQGYLRHHGFLFMAFLVSYWLYLISSENRTGGVAQRLYKMSQSVRPTFITLLLFVHFLAAGIATWYDTKYPFSASKQVGEYLLQNKYQDCIIFGDQDFLASPVAAWIDKKLYFPSIDAFGSYITWTPERETPAITNKEEEALYDRSIWEKARTVSLRYHKDVILVLSYHLEHELLAQFTAAIVKNEIYFLYKIDFERLASQSSQEDAFEVR